VGAYFPIGTFAGLGLLVVCCWWWRHQERVDNRDDVIEVYGRDVELSDVVPLRRDGTLPDGTEIGDRVDYDEWVDGTEPVRCPRCHAEIEARLLPEHACVS
jgi:hypothetical protein